MRKRISALLLSLILCLSLAGTAFAAGDWYVDDNGNIYQQEETKPPPSLILPPAPATTMTTTDIGSPRPAGPPAARSRSVPAAPARASR